MGQPKVGRKCCQQDANKATRHTFPSFLRADGGSHAVLAKKAPRKVGTGISQPHDHKDADKKRPTAQTQELPHGKPRCGRHHKGKDRCGGTRYAEADVARVVTHGRDGKPDAGHGKLQRQINGTENVKIGCAQSKTGPHKRKATAQ